MTQLKPNPEISARRIDEELYIFDRKNSQIHVFNESGAVLWDEFCKQSAPEQMIAALTDQFEVDMDTAVRDVGEFFTLLETRKLAIPA